jgi:hypothetical protein
MFSQWFQAPTTPVTKPCAFLVFALVWTAVSAASARAKDIQLTFDDSDKAGTPSISYTANGKTTMVEKTFNMKLSAKEKRDAFFDELTKKGFPVKFEKKMGDDKTLVFKDVPKGATINYANGGTGEFNEVLNGMDPISAAMIAFTGQFSERTPDGLLSEFQAGFFSDRGTADLQLFSPSFPSLSGSEISDTFFGLLNPLTPPLGIHLSHVTGTDVISATYDQGTTNIHGGVLFGTTATDGDVIACVTQGALVPEPTSFLLLSLALLLLVGLQISPRRSHRLAGSSANIS